MKYKFIEIRDYGETDKKGHRMYGIYSRKDNSWLGDLDYYPDWKQYAFDSNEDAVWSASCLRDVVDFLENHAGKGNKAMTKAEIKKSIEGVKVPRAIEWIGKPVVDFVNRPVIGIAFGPGHNLTWRILIRIAQNKCNLLENAVMFTAELAALARYMKAIEKALEE